MEIILSAMTGVTNGSLRIVDCVFCAEKRGGESKVNGCSQNNQSLICGEEQALQRGIVLCWKRDTGRGKVIYGERVGPGHRFIAREG